MTTAYSEALARVEQLYALLPAVQCQGRCAASCGPLALSVLERTRLVRHSGKKLANVATPVCPLLKHDRCSIYAVRPLICRLYGVTESMPCGYGCVPERWVSVSEAYAFLHAVEELSQAVFPGRGTCSFHSTEALVWAQEQAAQTLCHQVWGIP